MGEKILLSLPWYCYDRKTSPWSGINDYSVQEGGLEISVAKMGPQDESEAWGKDSARGSHGERSLKTVDWNEEEKLPLPKRSFGQFPYYYCTKKHLPKQDTEQWFLQLDRLSLMPSEVWVFWWAPELTALYKTLLMKNSAKSQAFSDWVIARKDSILICCKQISADLYLEKA